MANVISECREGWHGLRCNDTCTRGCAECEQDDGKCLGNLSKLKFIVNPVLQIMYL